MSYKKKHKNRFSLHILSAVSARTIVHKNQQHWSSILQSPGLFPVAAASCQSSFIPNQVHLFTPALLSVWKPEWTVSSVPQQHSASLSQLMCVGFWLEQTRASCGTETSPPSRTPLSVCLLTLWETWRNCWTWLWTPTRPTSAPVRSTSSEWSFWLMKTAA